MSNLQTYYHFKLDFQKVDEHTGGKWFMHDTKRRGGNIQGVVHLQNQNYLGDESLKVVQKAIGGNKNRNDNNNYHDENLIEVLPSVLLASKAGLF